MKKKGKYQVDAGGALREAVVLAEDVEEHQVEPADPERAVAHHVRHQHQLFAARSIKTENVKRFPLKRKIEHEPFQHI